MIGMGKAAFCGVALLAVSTVVVPAVAQEWGYTDKYPRVESVPAKSFAGRLLATHNRERARMGVPALEWDPALAAKAQQWANVIARKQSLSHADRTTRGGAGENLWVGTKGYYTAEEMIDTFIEEKRYFQSGTFPKVSTTGQWRDVGHYTQLIWRDTQKVGCAVAAGGGQDWLVCRYWPAGNTMGRPVY